MMTVHPDLMPFAKAYHEVTLRPPDKFLKCEWDKREDYEDRILDLCDKLGTAAVVRDYDFWLRAGNRASHIWPFIQLMEKQLRAKEEADARITDRHAASSSSCWSCGQEFGGVWCEDAQKFLCRRCKS